MKRLPSFFPTAVLILGLCVSPAFLHGQTTEQISGNWKGAIEIPGANLELSIEFSQKDGAWAGALSIPVQNVRGMALDELIIEGEDVRFKLPEVPGGASFAGKFEKDFTEIRGDFSQSGMALKMFLVKESAAQRAEEEARLARALDQFRLLADSLRVLRDVPGLAVGIVKDGKVILAEGFGYSNMEAKLPVTASTMFAIGSSTKAFTAAGLAMLVEEGNLAWDKPVLQYMPDFRLMDEFATREMTAVDLLSHQSGLPRHDLLWYGSSFSREDIFQRLRHLPPNKSFRTTWQYQNLMYLSAGILAERISGKSWEDFTRERIFEPLGMKHSVFGHVEVPESLPLALAYRKTEKEGVVRMPHRDIRAIGPAGSIYSNVEDMMQWVQLHLNSGKVGEQQVLAAGSIAKLHMPHKIMESSTSPTTPELSHRGYGLGWFVYRNKDVDIVQHGGNIDGFSALVYMLPAKGIGMVFLTNLNGNPLPGLLSNYATDLLLDREYIDWYGRVFGAEAEEPKKEKPQPLPNTQPSRPLKEFAGRYEHPGYGIGEVSLKDGQLHFSYNSIKGPVEHWHYDVFQAKITEFNQEILLTFHSDKSGLVTHLGIPLEAALSEDMLFAKLPPDLLSDPADVEAICGKYESTAFSVSFSMRQGKLYGLIPGQPEYELVPMKENWFSVKILNGYSVEFVFEKGKSKAAAVKFHQPNGVFTADRKD